jgi:hypothetical protein
MSQPAPVDLAANDRAEHVETTVDAAEDREPGTVATIERCAAVRASPTSW